VLQAIQQDATEVKLLNNGCDDNTSQPRYDESSAGDASSSEQKHYPAGTSTSANVRPDETEVHAVLPLQPRQFAVSSALRFVV